MDGPVAGKASFRHRGRAMARPQVLGRQTSLVPVLVGFVLTCKYVELLLNDVFPRHVLIRQRFECILEFISMSLISKGGFASCSFSVLGSRPLQYGNANLQFFKIYVCKLSLYSCKLFKEYRFNRRQGGMTLTGAFAFHKVLGYI